VAGKGSEKVKIFVTPQSLKAADDLRLGFLESSNPRKFNAMLQLATLNAARTMVKPEGRCTRAHRALEACGGSA
jgi:hypothetical protein